MKPEISIIIPTVNYISRKEQIHRILAVLESQKTSVPFEVIIVDNSFRLSENQFNQVPAFAKVIYEPRIGLSRARNAGLRVAVGDIIAFLDDDVIPATTWIKAIIQTHKLQKVLCVGGPVILGDRGSIRFPRWFSDYFLRFIVPPKFPESTGVVTAPYYIIGANMSFKRSVFDRYGFFDTNLGRVGNCLLSGEDMEFMMRVPPESIFYEPLAAVSMRIISQRLTRRYFTRRIFWQAVSDTRIFRKHGFDQYYDRSELFFSTDFSRRFLATLHYGLIFQAFCIIIRIITFKIVSFFNL